MKSRLLLVFLLSGYTLFSQVDLNYYLPQGLQFNPEVPTPEQVFGFQVGEFHLSPELLVKYLEILDRTSDRVSIEITGYSYEKRPLLLVAFTTPENQANLEKIRKDHLASIDPRSNQNNVREDFLIVQLGYSVHGNEASGMNAAPIVAYYLAACQDEELLKMLSKSVILIDPCLNPDGANRFSSWVNSRKSLDNNPDPNSIEFNEPYPGGRSNHYWYDLNRDWMLLQHPESQARINAFHRWKPQLLTDHHEMGSNSTFFFQPGVKTRSNPIIPESNFSLTQKIGTFHAKALDQIGSLYFTEEVFDDFYFGKGSSYPDLNGSIGILFEQASSRGHAQETESGVLSFPFTIRNQVTVSLSSLEGAWAIRKELLFNQKEYYQTALTEAAGARVKAYVFGSDKDPYPTAMMIDLLLQHQIDLAPLKKDLILGGQNFKAEYSYQISCNQPQYRMIRALMEKVTHFQDSTFYDISGWTLPLAFGVPYAELEARDLSRVETAKSISKAPGIRGEISSGIPAVAYLFEWDPYLAPKALWQMLEKGLILKVATAPFTLAKENEEPTRFDYGTILIPVQPQSVKGEELQSFLYTLAHENGLHIHTIQSGYTLDGPDLGSGSFSFIEKPKILMLSGGSVSSREAGQIWHLFDTRFKIPLTLGDIDRFNSFNLSRYNTLILPSGSYYELSEPDAEKIRSWVQNGGRIIALKSANNYLRKIGIINYNTKPAGAYAEAENRFLPFAQRRADYVGRSIPGTLFEAHLDLTHPLGYGYSDQKISIFRNTDSFIEPSKNPYGNPLYFTNNPVQSGFINTQNLEGLKGSISVMPNSLGRGKVISFFDDPTFRGYFAGEHKLLMNALFFGFLF